ncbi:alanine racemase [Actinoplanes awajinensis]|uniref:Alanine racemase n=1 Tax=Actinoplanes awajinensis subsp. mycoplanecinus TaxID=135947 RepID=A0A124G8D8_9ACTN|nr:alanine racemase [Actinoplanes awajinensis]KUL25586.1 alanine racemase [Actinoplanes awajinensis subsp. mycoplanecinus]
MLADLPTPYVTVDADVLDRNLRAMAGHAATLGLTLRPHAKTHKCVQIARRQVELGAGGLTVATVREAEIFADAGLTDLFIAYPIWPSAQLTARLRDLASRADLKVGVDSATSAEALARAVPGLQVLVEVDSGHHRSGVAPEAAADLAVAADKTGLLVRGVFTFPGHAYGPGRQQRAADDEATALTTAAAVVRAAGLDAGVRSGGSTPTAALTTAGPLTELRPGVYVFGDAQQAELGSCGWDSVALTVTSTVVSRNGPRIILDAGSKVLGADQQSWATGAGRLLDHLDARIVALSEHHATVIFPDGAPLPKLGDTVQVVPNHVCATVNLADELFVVSAGELTDRWPVAARGANT